LPYNITRVDSNDSIFLGDDSFRSEGLKLIQTIFDAMIEMVSEAMK